MHHLGAVDCPSEWRMEAYWSIPAHGPHKGAVNDIMPLVLGAGTSGGTNSNGKKALKWLDCV